MSTTPAAWTRANEADLRRDSRLNTSNTRRKVGGAWITNGGLVSDLRHRAPRAVPGSRYSAVVSSPAAAAAAYCSWMLAEILPRAETAMSFSLAQARMALLSLF